MKNNQWKTANTNTDPHYWEVVLYKYEYIFFIMMFDAFKNITFWDFSQLLKNFESHYDSYVYWSVWLLFMIINEKNMIEIWYVIVRCTCTRLVLCKYKLFDDVA